MTNYTHVTPLYNVATKYEIEMINKKLNIFRKNH